MESAAGWVIGLACGMGSGMGSGIAIGIGSGKKRALEDCERSIREFCEQQGISIQTRLGHDLSVDEFIRQALRVPEASGTNKSKGVAVATAVVVALGLIALLGAFFLFRRW
jgi:hypothetical protein